MTILIRVICDKNAICTYALLDTTESQRTFCDQRLVEKLKATGPKITLPIQNLSSRATSKKLQNVFTVSNIPMKPLLFLVS